MHIRFRAALGAALAILLVPAGAGAKTFTTTAGPPLVKPPAGTPAYADATQFFPATTRVHVGDTVQWKFFGFHNIYFPKRGAKNVPLFVPRPGKTYSDTDPAGAPYWFNGQTQLIGNPLAAFPLGGKTETGAKANGSGIPQSEKFTYKLKFTKAGTYTYWCTIHANMKGTVRVLSRHAALPSAAAVKKSVGKQVAAAIAEVRAADKRSDAAGNVVEAGRDTNRTSLLHFYPTSKTVPVGTTVDFRMSSHTNEVHTVTFGTDAVLAKKGYVEQLENALLSPLPGTGKSGPPELGVPGPAAFPSDQGPLTFDGSQHGGFVSSGVIGGAPLRTDAKFTFTKAGTYKFLCMIHPDMTGTIVVQ